MSRSLSATFKQAAFAQETGEAFLVLLQFNHASFTVPIRASSDGINTYSRKNEIIARNRVTAAADATLVGQANGKLPKWVDGQLGFGLEFDNNEEQYATAGNDFDLIGDFTIEAWVKIPDPVGGLSGQNPILIKDDGVDGWGLTCGADTITFFHRSMVTVTTTSSTGVLTPNTWHHIAAVFDDTANTVTVYVDGVQKGQTTGQTNVLGAISLDVRIGGRPSATVPRFTTGVIDDVRVWNIARSGATIAAEKDAPLVGNETGLVSYYPLDNDSIVPDLTTNNNDGLTFNGPIWTNGTPKILGGTGGLYFDGAGTQCAQVPDNALWNLDGQFTIECWFKVETGHSGGDAMMAHWTATDSSWLIRVANIDNDIEFIFSTTGTGETSRIQSNGAVTLDKWHHVAVTRNSSNLLQMYVDGVLQSDTQTIGNFFNSTAPLEFGAHSLGTSDFFQGPLSDIRIWNVERTQQEIQTNMNKRLVGNESGLVGYWPLSEGDIYLASGFDIRLLDEIEGQVPQAQLTIQNVDRRIIENIRQITSDEPVDCRLEVVLGSAVHVPEISISGLELRDIGYDVINVTGILTKKDPSSEQFPAGTFSPGRFPSGFNLI